MSYCVVAIHVKPLYGINNTLIVSIFECLVSLAVPCFFLISGYFIRGYNENDNSEKFLVEIRNRVFKMVRLYFIWCILYAPLDIIEYYRGGLSFMYGLVRFVYIMLFVGDRHLWYLLSIIYGLLFIYFCKRMNISINVVLIIGVIVYLIGVCMELFVYGQTRNGFIQDILLKLLFNGRLSESFLYLPVGMIIAEKEPSMNNKKKYTLLCTICAFGLYIYYLVGDLGKCFGSCLVAIAVFGVALGCEISVKKRISELIAFESKALYFTHIYIWTAFSYVIFGTYTYGMTSFISVVLITSAIGIMWFEVNYYIKGRLSCG